MPPEEQALLEMLHASVNREAGATAQADAMQRQIAAVQKQAADLTAKAAGRKTYAASNVSDTPREHAQTAPTGRPTPRCLPRLHRPVRSGVGKSMAPHAPRSSG